MLYKIVLFIHVGSAVAFFLIHGATASAMFGLKRERDPKRIKAMLVVRDIAEQRMGLPVITLLVSGIILGFMGRWWGETWIWISIGVFVLVGILMSVIGRLFNMRVAHALDPDVYEAPMKKEDRNSIPATAEELAGLQAKLRPMLLTITGIAGLAIILWLMMFKPF